MSRRYNFVCYPSFKINKRFKCLIDAINLSIETCKISIIFDKTIDVYLEYLESISYLFDYEYISEDLIIVYYNRRKCCEIRRFKND